MSKSNPASFSETENLVTLELSSKYPNQMNLLKEKYPLQQNIPIQLIVQFFKGLEDTDQTNWDDVAADILNQFMPQTQQTSTTPTTGQ